MKKTSFSISELAVALTAVMVAGYVSAETLYKPGFVQAKISSMSSREADTAGMTNLLKTVSADRIDETLTTLMADNFCNNANSKVHNPVSGRDWTWDDSNCGFVYEGQMYMVAGVTYTFWAQCDDNAYVWIGNTNVAKGGAGAGGYGSFIPEQTGWQNIHLVIRDGAGGKGGANGYYGFAWNTNGLVCTGKYLGKTVPGWNSMTDPGDGSLFRYAVDFDYVWVEGDISYFGRPEPYYGYAAIMSDGTVSFTGPSELFTNEVNHTENVCTGWQLKKKDGTVLSGGGLTAELTNDASLCGATLTWLFAPRQISYGDMYVVPPGTPGVVSAPPYASWETAATSVEDAIAAAGEWARINIAPGTYGIMSEQALSVPHIVIRSQTRDGKLARETTVLDCGYPARTNRLFNVTGASIWMEGLTIANAASDANGGGVYVGADYFMMNDCIVTNCWAGFPNGTSRYGGGIYLAGAYPNVLITNSLFIGCEARCGGGISGKDGQAFTRTPERNEAPVVSDCMFVSNEVFLASNGGAALNHAQGAGAFGSLWVENCTFRANRTTMADDRSAILALGTYAVANDCIFEGHKSTECKALVGLADNIGAGQILLSRCIFRDNDIDCLAWYRTTLDSCLIVSNRFAKTVKSALGGSTEVIFRNSLVAYNEGEICFGRTTTADNCTIVSNEIGICIEYGHEPTIRNCISFGNYGTPSSSIGGVYWGVSDFCYERGWSAVTGGTFRANIIIGDPEFSMYSKTTKFHLGDIDPTGMTDDLTEKVAATGMRFRDPEKCDWRLKRNSPLVDAGLKLSWMDDGVVDLAGNPRCLTNGKALADSLPDIGCYECLEKACGTALIVR